MGVFAHFQGRWDDALDLYRRAEQAWDKMGDRWHVALATLNVGEVLSDQGRMDEAEPLLRDALRVARASQSGPLLGEVTLRLGRLLSRTGRFEEAHAVLAEAREQYELDADARIAECFVLESEPRRGAQSCRQSALGRARSLDGGFDVLVDAPADGGVRLPPARSARRGTDSARARPRGGSTTQPRLRGGARARRVAALATRTRDPRRIFATSAMRSSSASASSGSPRSRCQRSPGRRRNPSPSALPGGRGVEPH